MRLYPTIELLEGRCVSLHRGRIDEPQIWHVDPVEKACEFADAGAHWLHITDFDAMAGDDRNTALIDRIVREAHIPVQLGGGVRTLHAAEQAFDRGIARVVVGTLAVLSPDTVKEMARHFPDQVVLAIDVFAGKVMSNAWRDPSTFTPGAFIRSFLEDPLAAVLVTDIDADLGEAEDSLALITELAGLSSAPVIASGLSRTLDDLARLKYVEPHISGAIIGRALFDKSIDLKDALRVAQAEVEKTAEFI